MPNSMDLEDQIRRAASKLKTWSAVAVVGAGASVELGLPLTRDLPALIWKVLDRNPDLLTQVRDEQGWIGVTGKEVIGSDDDHIQIALKAIEENTEARLAFQRGFAKLDRRKREQYSPAHVALAQLLHSGYIETLVSFNWDTLLETAFLHEYGVALKAGGPELYKPHGNAFDPEADWILPHQPGIVPDAILERVKELDDAGPHVLLLVGYSERDKEVVAKLTRPLRSRWPVIYVSPHPPSVTGDDIAVSEGASTALPELVAKMHIVPELPGWEHVTFHNQHPDLSSALEGRGLSAADVEACPRLPEVKRVLDQLAITGSALVTGTSGGGKSITAYQASYEMSKQGWEVVRLVRPGIMAAEHVTRVTTNLHHKRLVLVDDAQLLEPHLLRRLVESTSDRLVVLLVAATDVDRDDATKGAGGSLEYILPGRQAVEVNGPLAVSTIAKALLADRARTVRLVNKLDRRIGEGYLDTALEHRMEDAEKSIIPWQFMFVLTGGDWRIKHRIEALRNRDRTDILLAIIAARQAVTLDASVPREWLDKTATLLGRERLWVDKGLALLADQRLIMGGGPYRCPHARLAYEVLRLVCADAHDPEWPNIVRMLRAAVLEDNPPLQGVSSLLFDLWYADGFWMAPPDTLIDDGTFRTLAKRSWRPAEPDGSIPGVSMLNTILRWLPTATGAELGNHVQEVGAWIQQANRFTTGGLGWLLNDVRGDLPDLARAICGVVDPAGFAVSLNQATGSDSGGLAWVLSNLLASATDDWKATFRAALDMDLLLQNAREVQADDLWALGQVAEAFLGIDRELSLDLVEAALPRIAEAINRDPLRTFPLIQGEIIWNVLWCALPFEKRTPSPRQRNLAQSLGKAIDPVAMARGLSASRLRDLAPYNELFKFLREAAPRRMDRIAALTDLHQLDAVADPLWATLPLDFQNLLIMLARTKENEPACSWITRNVDKLDRLSPRVVNIAPKAALTAMRSGKTLDLDVRSGSVVRLAGALLAVHNLYKLDPEIAQRAVQQNYAAIAESLIHPVSKYFPDFLKVITTVDPPALGNMFELLDVQEAEQRWEQLLRGNAQKRRAIAALFHYASKVAIPVGMSDVIGKLTHRFPASATYTPDI